MLVGDLGPCTDFPTGWPGSFLAAGRCCTTRPHFCFIFLLLTFRSSQIAESTPAGEIFKLDTWGEFTSSRMASHHSPLHDIPENKVPDSSESSNESQHTPQPPSSPTKPYDSPFARITPSDPGTTHPGQVHIDVKHELNGLSNNPHQPRLGRSSVNVASIVRCVRLKRTREPTPLGGNLRNDAFRAHLLKVAHTL